MKTCKDCYYFKEQDKKDYDYVAGSGWGLCYLFPKKEPRYKDNIKCMFFNIELIKNILNNTILK